MIIPFFIMNRGCNHRCRFCNEWLTAGEYPERIEAAAFQAKVRSFLATQREGRLPVQIAFYGGTFTAMPEEEQERLLALAAPFLGRGEVGGIRLSTRPDALDPARIARLRDRGVTAIEVGAQSLDDRVLEQTGRGHGAEETSRAVEALQAAGIETGLHLMAGLPGDSPERFAITIEKTIALRPATVRIHPTLVLKDTALAEDFLQGRYRPLTLDEAVLWCGRALRRLATARIPVIRLGLQTTAALEAPGAILAGPFHPAFRACVEGSLFREMAFMLLTAPNGEPGASPREAALFSVAPADLSHFLGPGRTGLAALEQRYPALVIRVTGDPSLPRGSLALKVGDRRLQTDFSGLIQAKG